MFFEQPQTQEELEEARRERERVDMRNEEITLRIRRLVSSELPYDDLETVHFIITHIANAGSAAVLIANWYEGMLRGAMSVREHVLMESGEVDVDLK